MGHCESVNCVQADACCEGIETQRDGHHALCSCPSQSRCCCYRETTVVHLLARIWDCRHELPNRATAHDTCAGRRSVLGSKARPSEGGQVAGESLRDWRVPPQFGDPVGCRHRCTGLTAGSCLGDNVLLPSTASCPCCWDTVNKSVPKKTPVSVNAQVVLGQ